MSESKPRVYYAVWEDATLNDDDSVDEDGFCAGAISTRGGGNLHWDENQFPVVHKNDYDALKLENERLTKLVDECREENIKQVNWNIDKATECRDLRRERDRAHEMLKKMAGALELALHGLGHQRLVPGKEVLAEYRKEFGDNR